MQLMSNRDILETYILCGKINKTDIESLDNESLDIILDSNLDISNMLSEITKVKDANILCLGLYLCIWIVLNQESVDIGQYTLDQSARIIKSYIKYLNKSLLYTVVKELFDRITNNIRKCKNKLDVDYILGECKVYNINYTRNTVYIDNKIYKFKRVAFKNDIYFDIYMDNIKVKENISAIRVYKDKIDFYTWNDTYEILKNCFQKDIDLICIWYNTQLKGKINKALSDVLNIGWIYG